MSIGFKLEIHVKPELNIKKLDFFCIQNLHMKSFLYLVRILGIFYFAGLNYAPSSFIFMNIPSISQFQWHPFSITSSSSVDKHTMSVMMKCEGKWTDSVYKKLEEAADSNTKINNITIRVEGPYGPVSVDFLRFAKTFPSAQV